MKNHTLAVALTAIIWQPLCMGMLTEREIMQRDPKNYDYFMIKRIRNYDDAFSTFDIFQHCSLFNPYSLFRRRQLRTFDLNHKPRLQRLPITFKLVTFYKDESEIRLHSDLPPIVALDTFISHTTRNYK